VDLLEHRLVEREPASARGAGRLDVDLEHHALRHLVFTVDQPVQCGVEVLRLDFGEVTELPDVDPEHGNARLVRQIDGAQHGAVTAE
jgi:hypothetical protein